MLSLSCTLSSLLAVFFEKASPTFGINDRERQDGNLEVGLGDRNGCLLPSVN